MADLQARELKAIRALAVKAQAEGLTQRAYFGQVRAQGIKRRESDVLRPIWNQVQEARVSKEVGAKYRKLGYSPEAVNNMRKEAIDALRARSIRLSRSPYVTERRREVAIRKRMVPGKGVVPVVTQRYQYAGDIRITTGQGRTPRGEGKPGVSPQASRRFAVIFGSDKKLTRKQIENRIRDEWESHAAKYRKAYGQVKLGDVRITRAEELRPTKRASRKRATRARSRR